MAAELIVFTWVNVCASTGSTTVCVYSVPDILESSAADTQGLYFFQLLEHNTAIQHRADRAGQKVRHRRNIKTCSGATHTPSGVPGSHGVSVGRVLRPQYGILKGKRPKGRGTAAVRFLPWFQQLNCTWSRLSLPSCDARSYYRLYFSFKRSLIEDFRPTFDMQCDLMWSD